MSNRFEIERVFGGSRDKQTSSHKWIDFMDIAVEGSISFGEMKIK
jgi:hypothetical protein